MTDRHKRYYIAKRYRLSAKGKSSRRLTEEKLMRNGKKAYYAARHRTKLKQQTFEAYGGKPPRCAFCNAEDTAKNPLQLHHVNGDGEQHRKQIAKGRCGTYFYLRLRRLGFPNDPPLQVLCKSCNYKAERKYFTPPSHARIAHTKIDHQSMLPGLD